MIQLICTLSGAVICKKILIEALYNKGWEYIEILDVHYSTIFSKPNRVAYFCVGIHNGGGGGVKKGGPPTVDYFEVFCAISDIPMFLFK